MWGRRGGVQVPRPRAELTTEQPPQRPTPRHGSPAQGGREAAATGPSPGCQELAQKPRTARRLATVTLLAAWVWVRWLAPLQTLVSWFLRPRPWGPRGVQRPTPEALPGLNARRFDTMLRPCQAGTAPGPPPGALPPSPLSGRACQPCHPLAPSSLTIAGGGDRGVRKHVQARCVMGAAGGRNSRCLSLDTGGTLTGPGALRRPRHLTAALLGQGAGPRAEDQASVSGHLGPAPRRSGRASRSLEGPQPGSGSLSLVSAPPGSRAQAGLAAAGGALPAEPRGSPKAHSASVKTAVGRLPLPAPSPGSSKTPKEQEAPGK